MMPLFQEGDIVVLKWFNLEEEKIEPKQVFAIRTRGHGYLLKYIKEVDRQNREIVLASENLLHKDISLKLEEDVVNIFKVVRSLKIREGSC